MLYSSVSPLEVLVPQYSTSHPLDVSDYRTVRYRAVREHTNVALPHLTPAQQHLVSVLRYLYAEPARHDCRRHARPY